MDNWQILKLGDILKVKSGKDQKAVEREDGKYQILGTGGEIGRTNSFLYNKPSVLIGRKGTIDKPIYKDEPFWTVDTLFYTEIKDGFLPKYIYYLFLTINWRRYNEASGVPSLTSSTIETIKVKMPDLETQQKIVQILDTWNSAIELLDKRILNEKGKLIALQYNLFINANYETTPLGLLSSMHSGGTPNSKIEDFYGGDILWASIADMTSVNGLYLNETKKHLTEKGLNSSSALKIHPKGSVLYAMYASIGECVIAGKDMTSSQAILGINCKSDKLYNKYLYYYLTSNKQKIKTLGQQGTQSNLNAKMVKDFEIPLPPLEEQILISKKLDTQINLIQCLEDEKKVFLTQYSFLLNHLISGDFDLTNIKLENGKE